MSKRTRGSKPCCQVRVAWQKKPIAYMQITDYDDFLYFALRYKTINNVLEADKKFDFGLSKTVLDTYKKLVKEGAGDIPYRLWKKWKEYPELEKQRKQAQKIEAEKPEEPPEPVDDFLGILGKRESKELDLGFRVYRLVDQEGKTDALAGGERTEREMEEAERWHNENIPRLLSDVFNRLQLTYLRECCVRLKYDKEYRAEFEKQFNLKVVNYE